MRHSWRRGGWCQGATAPGVVRFPALRPRVHRAASPPCGLLEHVLFWCLGGPGARGRCPLARTPSPTYDAIGRVYARHRRPDHRVSAQVRAALGPARSVVDVGAGTGSYEPSDLAVVAVEPSAVMVAQRRPGSAPVVHAVAERLPFPDGSFDAALAVLTIHHWTDALAGLREM